MEALTGANDGAFEAVSGIYVVYVKAENAAYVGKSAARLWHRWLGHRSTLMRGQHYNVALQNAWNRYGEAGFVFEVLEQDLPRDELLRIEKETIRDLLASEVTVYNIYGSGKHKVTRKAVHAVPVTRDLNLVCFNRVAVTLDGHVHMLQCQLMNQHELHGIYVQMGEQSVFWSWGA